MSDQIFQAVAQQLGLNPRNVLAVLNLLSEGATIPFIARYRKDKTGALDEVQIQSIQETAKSIEEFNSRKVFIEKTITDQRKMTESLQVQLNAALTLSELEDLYLPYKPKRKTRAQKAREAGLEPLAIWLMAQEAGIPESRAGAFLNEDVVDIAAALKGARDIIAENVAEDAETRGQMRHLFEQEAKVITAVLPGKETEAAKYKDYFNFSEPVQKIPSHRILAVLRGFLEGYLQFSIQPDPGTAVELLEQKYLTTQNEAAAEVAKALKDAYRRLLQPSLETEWRNQLKARADEEAINVFAENLRQLLLSSPLGNKNILAIDPGYRTGCKAVALDKYGNLLHHTVIFVHEQNQRLQQAENTVKEMVAKYQTECFAIGNGTAGRETEQFIRSLNLNLPVFLINEDGASVYSASEIAREEFPQEDITVRGAVSIGRRLMDPLAELVKIDPKSIGVGQYQHDVNQQRLKERLDQTVESCVNAVGANLNTSGKYLLQYVSGIGMTLAGNIVNYRNEHGGFKSRRELLSVARLGPAAYEQCAGFLRIAGGDHPLDASGVHPEAYPLVERMAGDLNVSLATLIGNEKLIGQIVPGKYIDEQFGRHTVTDVLKELRKPGRDPRSELQTFEYAAVYKMEDLSPGMILPGIVTNLTRFGAFVDIGIKQDGLVHISEMSHRYISDPSEVLKLNQQVNVKVLEVEVSRNRISLSIKQAMPESKRPLGGQQKKAERKPAKPVTGKSFSDALVNLKNKFK
ncbi:MAG TPA: Tex family protein [Edaphocola sp.]|nr:Tex family protein [Edaphocola sp.]